MTITKPGSVRMPSDRAVEALGKPGSLLGSRALYADENPHNVFIFNARVLNQRGEEIWGGDLDLTLQADNLISLSEHQGPILVVPEQDCDSGIFRWFSEEAEIDGYKDAVMRKMRHFPFRPDTAQEDKRRVAEASRP